MNDHVNDAASMPVPGSDLIDGDAVSADVVRRIDALQAALDQQTMLREAAERRLQSRLYENEDELEHLILKLRDRESELLDQVEKTEAALESATSARVRHDEELARRDEELARRDEEFLRREQDLAEAFAADKAALDDSLDERLAEVRSASSADLDTLRAQLRDTRSTAATASRYAREARRAMQDRYAELGRHRARGEQAASAARAEVERLAAEAEALVADEDAAQRDRGRAQETLDAILREERRMLLAAGGVRDALSLGGARRWRRKYKTFAMLVSSIDSAAADLHAAQIKVTTARDRRSQAEQVALEAEVKATEMESAVAVIRNEIAAMEAMLAGLPAFEGLSGAFSTDEYGRWAEEFDTLSDADRRAIKARLTRLDYTPLISIVMPVYNTPLTFLRQAIASVQAQLYEKWELCIADDASPDAEVRATLRGFAEADPRIKVVERDVNGHISAASNSALDLAEGEFIALLDHDDILPQHALFEVVASLNDNPDLDLIYSDEDHIDRNGLRSDPYFKCDFNHELMLGHNLINHFGVYRRAVVEQIGGFRLGYEGSQDYDLALRVIDASNAGRIHHIPAVLYHWRSDSGDATFSETFMQRCIDSARKALADHLARRSQPGTVVEHPVMKVWQRVRRHRPDPAPLVSIIVPTKDKAEILQPCIEGLLDRTDYPNIEVIIVDHQSTQPSAIALMAELSKDSRVRILPYTGPFNYSAINNAAVEQSRGSILALLNNDVDVINSDWLDEMVALAALPDVGAVGAKLLYPDGRVQHAGVILGPGGVAGHLFHLLGQDDPGYFGRAVLTSDVAAVTAACLVVRKAVFEEVGGFDSANLAVAFNDVDLCLKIRQAGYRNVLTPHAKLHHHESLSRGSDEVGERLERFHREVGFMMEKWDEVLQFDPYYNPNLDLASATFSMAFPPRRKKPWQTVHLTG